MIWWYWLSHVQSWVFSNCSTLLGVYLVAANRSMNCHFIHLPRWFSLLYRCPMLQLSIFVWPVNGYFKTLFVNQFAAYIIWIFFSERFGNISEAFLVFDWVLIFWLNVDWLVQNIVLVETDYHFLRLWFIFIQGFCVYNHSAVKLLVVWGQCSCSFILNRDVLCSTRSSIDFKL